MLFYEPTVLLCSTVTAIILFDSGLKNLFSSELGIFYVLELSSIFIFYYHFYSCIYSDIISRSLFSPQVDESWVLPAIVQLGGVPVVTDEGNIVYQFQVSDSNSACSAV
jgi:hypothetical protein